MYETCGQGLVEELMRGFNGTLLAYGETGAGSFNYYSRTSDKGPSEYIGTTSLQRTKLLPPMSLVQRFHCIHLSLFTITLVRL